MLTNILTIAPLAVVMVTGPQILTAMIFATKPNRVSLTLRYLLGAVIGMLAVIGIAFFTGFTISNSFTLPGVIKWTVIALLALAMVTTLLGQRGNTEEAASETTKRQPNPIILGMFLLGVFPTDLLTNLAVGASLSERDQPIGYLILFLAITLAFLLIPLGVVAVMGSRADTVLAAISRFIRRYSWVLTEIICLSLIVFFWQH